MNLTIVILFAATINLVSIYTITRRLLKLRRFIPASEPAPTLILPLTGTCPGLGRLIEALNAQTLQPRRLLICVESPEDPAHARTRSIEGLARFPVDLVVAGLAVDQGQKCRNQQAGLDRLDGRDTLIVLLDGDILPQPSWLGQLIEPVVSGGFDIVSGHRWQCVARHRLGAHLIASIDRALTIVPRLEFGFAGVVWGGSTAMSRRSAERMDLRRTLARTLSDDLSIAQSAAAAGLRTVTRGSLLVPSPTELAFVPAWRFARRQYQIVHLYRPLLWWLAFTVIGLRIAGYAAALFLALEDVIGLLALSALAGLGLLKQYLTGEFARRAGHPDPASVRCVQLFFGLLQVLPDIFHLSVILGAARIRLVHWGHIAYEIAGPGDIRVKERTPFSG